LKTLFRFLGLMCLFAWAAAGTWWAFRKEHGVDADDPDKERDA
jgi:cbb3-type cytochrome oxidase subunit 3